MQRTLLSIVVFVFLTNAFFIPVCHGQVNIDSLLSVWNNEKLPDTVRILAIEKLTNATIHSSPDSAYVLAQRQYDLALKLGDRRQECNALNIQGYCLAVKSQYETAIEHYLKSFDVGKEIGYELGMARALNNIGLVRSELGDLVGAVNYYQQSLRLKEKMGNPAEVIPALINIANLYEAIGEPDTAIARYQRALVLCNQVGHVQGSIYCTGNMGIIYKDRKQYDKADTLLRKALLMARQINDQLAMARCLGGLGMVEKERGNYVEALELFRQCIEIGEKLENRDGMGVVYYNLGEILREQGDLHQAEVYGLKAMEISKEVSHLASIKNAANGLYLTYKTLGNSTKALEMHELYITMRDSIMSEENQRETIRTEFSRENEQSKAEIGILNLENEKKEAERLAERRKRFLTLGGGTAMVLLLSVGGGWFYTDRRKRHVAELQWAAFEKNLLENDYLRSRLNTHFMKNALQSINGLISNGQHTKAQEYIDRFHRLMQWTLENASSDTVSLSEELEMMEHYLTLEQPCAEDGLSWEVQVADDVDADDVMLPPLILQPFLENALLHGMKNTGRPGHVRIAVERKGQDVVCTVEDNGRGMASGAEAKPHSTGLRLVRERLAMFSPTAAMRMENTGSGTRAEVRLAA